MYGTDMNDSPSSRRTVFDHEHEAFRDSFRTFLHRRVIPEYDKWEADGLVPREVFVDAGAHGFLGMAVDDEAVVGLRSAVSRWVDLSATYCII